MAARQDNTTSMLCDLIDNVSRSNPRIADVILLLSDKVESEVSRRCADGEMNQVQQDKTIAKLLQWRQLSFELVEECGKGIVDVTHRIGDIQEDKW